MHNWTQCLRTTASTALFPVATSAIADDPSAASAADSPELQNAVLSPPPVPDRASTARLALETTLLVQFRDVLRQRSLDAEGVELNERLELRLAGPDRLEGSRLRTRDETGAHNDFRLEHSGNLLRIPLQR